MPRCRRCSDRSSRRVAFLLTLSPLGACGADAPAEVTTVGDTTIVANRVPLIRDTLTPVEVARYGRAEGEPEYLFADIFSFGVGPDGDVYVHDRNEGIRRFSPDGAYVRHIARNGEGPGEVGYVLGIGVAPDGRVAAHDLRNQRVSVFGADPGPGSEEVAGLRRPDGQPRYRAGSITFLQDGSLWVGVNPRYGDREVIPHPRPVFVRVGDDGSYPDTIFTPARLGDDCPTLSARAHARGFWEDARAPFVPKAKWSLASSGELVIGCPRRYAFEVLHHDGRVTRVSRPWTPLTLPDAERDFRERFGRGGALPELRPAYATLVPTEDGRIWVWPTQPNIREPLPPETIEQFGVTHTWVIGYRGAFDVFDADGTWRAVVRLPEGARYSGYPTEPDVVVRGDTIWAVARDELDVEYVVRYEVSGLGGGG
jgi:hypothetical protein